MVDGLKEVLTFRDVKGNTAHVSFFVAATGTAITQQTAANNVTTAMEPLTNCGFQGYRGPATSTPTAVTYGTAAQFAGVEDKAVYTFAAADGALHRVQVPAPTIAQFEVDQETVDAAQTDAAAFITAFLANAVTQQGLAMTSFVGGIRKRSKLRRKLTIYLKVPELDEPAE